MGNGAKIELPDGDWFKYIVVASLLTGTVSGGVGLTRMDDRFRGQDFADAIGERDQQIAKLQQRDADRDFEFKRLEERVRELELYRLEHTAHASTYTAFIDELRDERRRREAEKRSGR